jgi:membrane-bound ClpP family serine protease
MGVGEMAKNEKHLIDALKSAEVWLLAVLLVLTLGVAFYQMGLGVMGMLIGIILVLRLFRMTGRGGSRWGL